MLPGAARGIVALKEDSLATLVWLLAWLVAGTPDLEWFGVWNDWAVALVACIVFDAFGGRQVAARR
jgi:hypothetical protein